MCPGLPASQVGKRVCVLCLVLCMYAICVVLCCVLEGKEENAAIGQRCVAAVSHTGVRVSVSMISAIVVRLSVC